MRNKLIFLLILIFFIVAYMSSAQVPNPVAYWNFDESHGVTSAYDSYAPEINGTLKGGIIRVPGISNNCLKFTGSQYVDMGDVNGTKLDIFGQNPITVSAWVRPFSLASDRQILSKGYNGTNTQYELKTTSSDGKVSFRCFNVGEVQSTIPLQVNTWTHVVGVFEPTGGTTGIWRIYFNGVNRSNMLKTGQPVHTTQDFDIGAVDDRLNPVQYWWDGLIDEVKVWNVALTDAQIQSLYTTQTQSLSFGQYLKLWLDPLDLDADGNANNNPANNTLINLWKDKTDCQENATISLVNRKPAYKTGTSGINSFFPCVQFYTDYGASKYGYSDILEILSNQSCGTVNYFNELTSEVSDKWSPVPEDKTLILVFQTSNSSQQTNPAYYADGRQTLAEFGGPLSGYNIYINQGMLIFGMWNRFESKFLMLQTPEPLFPIGTNATYLAHLEYHKAGIYKTNFRAIVSKYTPKSGSVPPYTMQQWVSPWMKFSGLTKDDDDNSGIGGACRTRFYDYCTGETHSNHFGGKIGDVMVLNNSGVGTDLYDYFKQKYLVDDLTYPAPSGTPAPRESEWFLIENNPAQMYSDGDLSISANPNPFNDETYISAFIPESQNVRLDVLDMTGKLILTAYNSFTPKGMHNFVIDGGSLVTGGYMAKLTGDSFVKSVVIFVNK